MPERLTECLKRRGLLNTPRAKEAMERQVLLGGALDTSLLELQLVKETDLVEALSAAYGLATATPKEVTCPLDLGAVRAFPEQWARKHMLAPLTFERESLVLSVLSPAPADVNLIVRLGELLEITIRPLLAPEFRVHQRLSLIYDVAPPERFHGLIQQQSENEGPKALPTKPPAPTIESRPVPLTRPLTFGEAVTRLRDAGDRDEIAHTTLLYAFKDLEFVAMFIVQDPKLEGWLGIGPGAENVPQVSVELSRDSAFRVVLDTQAHYLGPLPADDLHRGFLDRIGRPHPRAVLIVPVRIRNRTVALMYGENGAHTIPPRLAADLMLFTTHVQGGLETLLMRRKAGDLVELHQIETGDLPTTEEEAPPADELPSPLEVVRQELKEEEEAAAQEQSQPPEISGEYSIIRQEEGATPPADEHEEDGWDSVDIDVGAINGDAPELPEPTAALDATESAAQQLVAEMEAMVSGPADGNGGSLGVAPTWGEEIDSSIPAEVSDPDLDALVEPEPVPELTSNPLESPAALPDVDAVEQPEQPIEPVRLGNVFGPDTFEMAVLAETEDGKELLDELGDLDEADLAASPKAPVPESEGDGWESVEVNNWGEEASKEPEEMQAPPAPVATEMRASLVEDATVPDLSAEAWIRASTDTVRPRELPEEIIYRASLEVEEPVPLTNPTSSIKPSSPVEQEEPVPLTTPSRSSLTAAEPLPPAEEDVDIDIDEEPPVMEQKHPPTNLQVLDQEPEIPPEPKKPELSEQIDDGLERLFSSDPERQKAGRDKLTALGTVILPSLDTRFPGPLTIDPFSQNPLPAFPDCGALLELMGSFGRNAHPYMAHRLDNPDPIHRFFSTYFYSAVFVPEAIPKLIQRLHDEEPRLCMLAARTLFSYRGHPGFADVLEHLHGRLKATSMAARRHAAYLIGLFRDVTAVPDLIDLFDKKERSLYDVAEDALAEITKQRLGPSARKWRTWWLKHQTESRIAWLIDGLGAKDATLRRSAAEELRAVTRLDMGYDEDAPKRVREDARLRWVRWWESQQHNPDRSTET